MINKEQYTQWMIEDYREIVDILAHEIFNERRQELLFESFIKSTKDKNLDRSSSAEETITDLLNFLIKRLDHVMEWHQNAPGYGFFKSLKGSFIHDDTDNFKLDPLFKDNHDKQIGCDYCEGYGRWKDRFDE